MHLFCALFLVFSGYLTLVESEDILDCRYNDEYPTMQNFNISRMVGRWYNIKKGPTPDDLPPDFENTQNCYTIDIARNPNNDFLLSMDSKYVNSKKEVIQGTKDAIVMVNRDNPAWWNPIYTHVYAGVSVQNHFKWIAGDYDNWVIHIACGPYNGSNIYMFQVLSRTKDPNPEVIGAIDALIESLVGVKPSQMEILHHTDCPF